MKKRGKWLWISGAILVSACIGVLIFICFSEPKKAEWQVFYPIDINHKNIPALAYLADSMGVKSRVTVWQEKGLVYTFAEGSIRNDASLNRLERSRRIGHMVRATTAKALQLAERAGGDITKVRPASFRTASERKEGSYKVSPGVYGTELRNGSVIRIRIAVLAPIRNWRPPKVPPPKPGEGSISGIYAPIASLKAMISGIIKKPPGQVTEIRGKISPYKKPSRGSRVKIAWTRNPKDVLSACGRRKFSAIISMARSVAGSEDPDKIGTVYIIVNYDCSKITIRTWPIETELALVRPD